MYMITLIEFKKKRYCIITSFLTKVYYYSLLKKKRYTIIDTSIGRDIVDLRRYFFFFFFVFLNIKGYTIDINAHDYTN